MKKWKYKIGWIGLLFLAGCSSSIELKKQTFTIELGHDVYSNPSLYAKDSNQYNIQNMKVAPVTSGIAKKENRFVSLGSDYLAVGEYNFELVNGNTSVPFKIKIKDTRPPTLTNTPSEINASLGQVIDWDSVFEASDLSGVSYQAPSETTSTSGEHDITVKIFDRYGNAIDQPIKVIVG